MCEPLNKTSRRSPGKEAPQLVSFVPDDACSEGVNRYLTELLDALLDEGLVVERPGVLDLLCPEHAVLAVARTPSPAGSGNRKYVHRVRPYL